MGVWARELTREAIWDGMKGKHVYATSGDRILLSFDMLGDDEEIPSSIDLIGNNRIISLQETDPSVVFFLHGEVNKSFRDVGIPGA